MVRVKKSQLTVAVAIEKLRAFGLETEGPDSDLGQFACLAADYLVLKISDLTELANYSDLAIVFDKMMNLLRGYGNRTLRDEELKLVERYSKNFSSRPETWEERAENYLIIIMKVIKPAFGSCACRKIQAQQHYL